MPDRPITDLIHGGPVDHVDADTSVLEAVRYMAKVKRGAVPVITEGRLVGMFSERDLMLRVVLAGHDPEQTPVSAVMTRDLVVAQLTETHRNCLAKMKQMHFRHLPVVDGDRLLGLISLRDLMEKEADEQSQHIDMLNYLVHYSPD